MNNILDYKYLRIAKYFKRTFYSSFVTTPIFYVNAAPHIGHLYSALIADAYHRFQVLKYPDKNAIFSTGTDEHGLKVQQAAQSTESRVIREYCDKISIKYKTLFDLYGINYTHFIRTTDAHHENSVQTFWNELTSKGFVYEGKYTGWYCVSDEMFLSEDQLTTRIDANGREIKVSEVSGHPVEWNEEDNFMFKLSQVRDDLLYWLKDETKIAPLKFHKILLGWLHEGYTSSDISISRPSSRIPWGIPVPNHPTQTIYVWLDALVNYLTVAGYPNLKTWPPSVQIVGKDILKFHGIYWPAFLIAAGLEPPSKLFVHSHWTVDDEKMSKSKNNVVDPYDKIKTYTASGFRYFLLKEGVPHSDGNYNEPQVVNMLNADLANTFGNLLNRCCSKTVNSLQVYPQFNESQFCALLKEYDTLKNLSENICNLQDVVSQHYEELHFYKGIYAVLDVLYLSNKLVEETKPWELRKNPVEAPKLSAVLHVTMEALRICGIALLPIVPEISQQLFKKLSIPPNRSKWENMRPSWSEIPSSNVDISLLNESVVLYKKIQTK